MPTPACAVVQANQMSHMLSVLKDKDLPVKFLWGFVCNVFVRIC